MALKSLVPWKSKNVPVRRIEDPFLAFRREMDRLFDEFFSGFGLTPFESQWGGFQPRVDVAETDKEIKVSAELPGLDENDIEVTLTDDVLTISGEKKEEKEDKGRNYYRMERSYGSFSRSIPLPCQVEQDKVEATFKKGVLTITLPKTAEAQKERKKIAIKTS
ncbi:MAG: Hsp20/alpha crystallin family protein [Chloroflexi bacterium]|nr:MAG: Hsp20/alpha crystallin family protein [Chloroflexota bacterium]